MPPAVLRAPWRGAVLVLVALPHRAWSWSWVEVAGVPLWPVRVGTT